MLLCLTAHEEDLPLHLDLLYKVVVEEILVPSKEGDAVMVVDAEADGSVVDKADQVALRRPNLAYSVITVASMDTTHRSVQKAQVHPAVAILLSL